jgi:molybdopterin/thiamine biosynthesis adenylyltransferase
MNQPALGRDRVLNAVLPENPQFKIIGLGGTGGILAKYLALFLASFNEEARLVFIDGDSFEPANSLRMFFGEFGNKARVTAESLVPYFAHSRLTIVPVEEYVTPKNVRRLIRPGDHVFLTVDNHATRHLVNGHCARLANVCLISGGNDPAGPDSTGLQRRGTYGNVQIFWRSKGKNVTPNLARYHPEIAQPADRLPSDQSCTEVAATGRPQILFANLAVASAMLNALWLHLCGALHYSELALDIADGLMRPCQLVAQGKSGK